MGLKEDSLLDDKLSLHWIYQFRNIKIQGSIVNENVGQCFSTFLMLHDFNKVTHVVV